MGGLVHLAVRPSRRCLLLILLACGGPERDRDPLPQPLVERATDCVWADDLRHFRRGPSPIASEPPRACERAADESGWRGCVHLDLSRPACINGCSECLAYVVGERGDLPSHERVDRCWRAPDLECAITYGTGGDFSAGHPYPAPTYDCAIIDGTCTEVPLPDRASPP